MKTFADYSLVLPKDATLPSFAEKTFINGHKTSKFVKVFFPSEVSCYTILDKGSHWKLDQGPLLKLPMPLTAEV